jgi:hypothetical protein
MRRSTCLLVVQFVAVLAIGCNSETSPSPPEPKEVKAETPPPDANGGPRLALKKKKKEPGVSTVPTTSRGRRSEL